MSVSHMLGHISKGHNDVSRSTSGPNSFSERRGLEPLAEAEQWFMGLGTICRSVCPVEPTWAI